MIFFFFFMKKKNLLIGNYWISVCMYRNRYREIMGWKKRGKGGEGGDIRNEKRLRSQMILRHWISLTRGGKGYCSTIFIQITRRVITLVVCLSLPNPDELLHMHLLSLFSSVSLLPFAPLSQWQNSTKRLLCVHIYIFSPINIKKKKIGICFFFFKIYIMPNNFWVRENLQWYSPLIKKIIYSSGKLEGQYFFVTNFSAISKYLCKRI